MSQENVEVVRRIFEEDEEGLFDRGWERILDFWDPRGDYYPVGDLPESRPYHGAKEIARFFNEFQQPWGRYEIRIKAITPVGDDRVLAHARHAAEGRESGLNLQIELFHCFWLRHGRVFRQEDHVNLPGALRALGLRGETLEAAGLSEQTMSPENAIRAGYKALSDGDLDAFLETLDPDIELLTSGAFPDFEPSYRGYDGVSRFWAAISAPWESFHLDPERIVESEDRAAVAVHFRVRGAGSGVTTELRQGHALWFSRGRTRKVSTHPSFDQALEAVGLREEAMSQKHMAYRVADAFNRRDLDAVLALTDDDVEVVTRAAAMEGGYHGHDGVRRFWEDWLSVFPDSNIEVVEVRDVGDLTVAATRLVGHGARSGTPLIEETVWQAVRWSQGKIIWWGTFGTRAEALEAVGLSEQDTHADS